MHERLHQAGMSEIVLQYAVVEGAHRYYPSALEFTADEPDRESFFPESITAAKTAGNHIWLGLYYDDSGWWTPPSVGALDTLAARNVKVLKELYSLYGAETAVSGVYLPQELNRYYWNTDSAVTALVEHFLRPVTDSAHALGWRVLSAPFFNSDLETPEQSAAFMNTLFGASWKPDVLAPQDGVGAQHVSLEALGNYLRALAAVCRDASVDFWVDAELFEASSTASWARIEAQVDTAVAAGALKVIGYDLSVLGNAKFDSLEAFQVSHSTGIAPDVFLKKPGARELEVIRYYDLLGRRGHRNF
jgi:hypothetical protein